MPMHIQNNPSVSVMKGSSGKLLLDFSQNAGSSKFEASQLSVSPPRYNHAIMGHSTKTRP